VEHFETMKRSQIDPRSRFFSRRNDRGSFLLSMMLFITLIVTFLTVVWKFAMQKQDKLQDVKLQSARSMVLTSALRSIRVGPYYYRTLLVNDPVNVDFYQCMIGDDGLGNDCISLDGSGNKVDHFVRLYDENANAIIGQNSTNTILYDLYGQVCAPASLTCPFEVYGSYTVVCDGGTSSCAQAYEIDATVYVKFHSSITGLFASSATIEGVQKVAIGNFFDYHNPIIPPPTPWGTPIIIGAGPGGFVVTQVTNATSTTTTTTTTSTTAPTTTTSSTTTTVPPSFTIVPCGPGQRSTPSGTCVPFTF